MTALNTLEKTTIIIDFDSTFTQVEGLDELGRIVFSSKTEFTKTNSIDLSTYSNGIYTLVLKGTDFTEMKKVQLLK